MSVYTHLSNDQFAAFCHAFGIAFYKAIPITQGIKNSNWFIQSVEDVQSNQGTGYSYVFTLFEERPPEDIEKMARVVNALSGHLPVAAPLAKTTPKADGSADYLIHYENKAILLVPCLAGSHPVHITPGMCATMGQALATLHTTLQSLTPAEAYGVPLYPWHKVRDREMQFMPADEANLMRAIWQGYQNLPLQALPKGLCHLDMFADNTLWQWDKKGNEETASLTGLLDFTEVSVEHYVMDIAITINDFCTTWGAAADGETVNFDKQKMQAFIQGYERHRPLSSAEKEALPVMLAMAAVTFWLLRLNVIYYNREQGRSGDNIMVKNPDLMKRLAAYHWSQVEKLQQDIGKTVYVLAHTRDKNDDSNHKVDGFNLVGVFATEQQAQTAMQQLTAQPGFKQYHKGFYIEAYPLGQIHWSSGFGER